MGNPPPRDRSDDGLRRREALTLLGGAGLSGLLAGCGPGEDTGGAGGGATSAQRAAETCLLTPETTEGPYWIDTNLTRRDIREDRPGLPLVIVFTVQNARTCKPIKRADVEIWHCDARGEYSGFEGGLSGGPTETRYLRGHQRANARGQAKFLTVFPGWYPGRTPHIHLKVHTGGDVVHTGQVFFDDDAAAAVYRRRPYRAHGQADVTNTEDGIYAQAGRSRARLRLRRREAGRPGYRGTITLGVAT